MIVDILLISLLISVLINAVDLVSSVGYILYKPFLWLRIKLKKSRLEFLSNPIFGCVVCMSSFWGTIFYWSLWSFFPWEQPLEVYIFVIIALPIFNVILSNVIEKLIE